MEAYDFKHNKVPLFARKQGNINTSRSAAPKLALVPASRYYCDRCKLVIPQCMCQVSLGLKEVHMLICKRVELIPNNLRADIVRCFPFHTGS